MPVFTRSGTRHKDRWLIDDKPEFAVFPGGVIAEVGYDLPIFLYVGTPAYGETHIRVRHAVWVKDQGLSVPELVHTKLCQPGLIYCTEENHKLKISLRLAPSSLMVLTLKQSRDYGEHLSVTTLYAHPQRLDGLQIGRYPGKR
jgi:hypothetical protein